MKAKLYIAIQELKVSIESGDLGKLTSGIKIFNAFLSENKNEFYEYLNSLKNEEHDFDFDRKRFREDLWSGISFFEGKFNHKSGPQSGNIPEIDIAEIYTGLIRVLYLLDLFEKNADYNIFFEILFELYDHILPNHIINLKEVLQS